MQIIEIQPGAAPKISVPDKFPYEGHINKVLSVCSEHHELFASHGGPVTRSEVILATELTRVAQQHSDEDDLEEWEGYDTDDVLPNLINTIDALLGVRGIKAAAKDVAQAWADELAEYISGLPSEDED